MVAAGCRTGIIPPRDPLDLTTQTSRRRSEAGGGRGARERRARRQPLTTTRRAGTACVLYVVACGDRHAARMQLCRCSVGFGAVVLWWSRFLFFSSCARARSQDLSIDEMMRFVRKSHMGRRKPGSRFASGEQVSCASTETLYCAFKEKDLIKTRIIGWSLACTN